MDKEIKETILVLRAEGLGHKRISSEFGLNINSVKSFCRSIEKRDNFPHPSICQHCGAEIEKQGQRVKKFCSDTCRNHWWQHHRSELNRKSQVSVTCRHCQKSFQAYEHEGRKFCSHHCYILHRFW